jgi:hypothetical protein
MIQNNVEDLTQKVKSMVIQGILAPQEQVGDDSFVVGTQQNDLGETVNPRLQFACYAIPPELKAKLIGAKAGDVLNLEEKLKFCVSEIYQIQAPKAAEAPAAPAAEAAPTEAPPADAGLEAPAQDQAPSAQPDQSVTSTA